MPLIDVEPTTPGGQLRADRLAAGVTLVELARLIGCPQSYLSYVERNVIRADRPFMARAYDVLAAQPAFR